MAKSVLDALKGTGCADLNSAIEAISAKMFLIKEPSFASGGKGQRCLHSLRPNRVTNAASKSQVLLVSDQDPRKLVGPIGHWS